MNNEIIKIESVNNYLGKVKKAIKITLIIVVVGLVLLGIANMIISNHRFSLNMPDSEYEKLIVGWKMESAGITCLIIGGIAFAITGLFYLITKEMKIVVTDKRVYGKTIFGKQVDLPFDSISAIAKSWFKGIAVATASGRIVFLLISNNEEIFKTISDLLIQRQDKKEGGKQTISTSNNAEELKQYKELLDSGIITQEEFEAKKKKLLGL